MNKLKSLVWHKENKTVNFGSQITLLVGRNFTGKSHILDILMALAGKNDDLILSPYWYDNPDYTIHINGDVYQFSKRKNYQYGHLQLISVLGEYNHSQLVTQIRNGVSHQMIDAITNIFLHLDHHSIASMLHSINSGKCPLLDRIVRLLLPLLNERGQIVILRNPEMGLHYESLRKFIESVFKVSRKNLHQLVIETQSDHILNAVRFGIKSGFITKDEVVINSFTHSSIKHAYLDEDTRTYSHDELDYDLISLLDGSYK